MAICLQKPKSKVKKLWQLREQIHNEKLLSVVELYCGHVCLRQTQILGTVIEGLIISLCRLHLDLFQIIMLNSVSDLHGYIDKCQLTWELGGTLEYGHSQWIHHRTVSAGVVLTHDYTYKCRDDECKATIKQQFCSCTSAYRFYQRLMERGDPLLRENSPKVCCRSSNLYLTIDLDQSLQCYIIITQLSFSLMLSF